MTCSKSYRASALVGTQNQLLGSAPVICFPAAQAKKTWASSLAHLTHQKIFLVLSSKYILIKQLYLNFKKRNKIRLESDHFSSSHHGPNPQTPIFSPTHLLLTSTRNPPLASANRPGTLLLPPLCLFQFLLHPQFPPAQCGARAALTEMCHVRELR